MGNAPQFVNLLPLWVTWVWLVALTAVLVLHCAHFVRMGGQHRWFHASHILMLVSQIYMYAGMAYMWTWFPHTLWVNIFWLSSAAIGIWMVVRLVQRRPFSALWLVALIMQVSMAYMWMPKWMPALTWALVVYFSLEALAWLAGLLDDSKPSMGIGPRHTQTTPPPAELVTASGGPATSAVGVREQTVPKLAFVPLFHNTVASRVSMAVMAASMAYMFAAMQLMRSAMM